MITFSRWLIDQYGILEPVGFEPVTYRTIKLKDHYHSLWNHCHSMGLEELRWKMEGDSTDSEQLRNMQEHLGQLSSEFDQGASIDAEWFIMVGRKPATRP